MTNAKVFFNKKWHEIDFSKPIDISIPIKEGAENPNCYWASDVRFDTISEGDFVGSVAEGGSVNYQKLTITPHGNGTHTECYGHLDADPALTIYDCLKQFHFFARLVTATPEVLANGDQVITLLSLADKIGNEPCEALIIRSLPNTPDKKKRKYTNTNPPYLEPEVCKYLADNNVQHLLIDLPSVDREVDGGKLLAHRAFWKNGNKDRMSCTITELIYAPSDIPDGEYILNLQVTSLTMDASPSKPVLFKIENI